MSEAIAVYVTFGLWVITMITGFFVLRSIKEKDKKEEEQDRRLNSHSESIGQMKEKLAKMEERDKLQLEPIKSDIQEIKQQMVTKESFEAHRREQSQFKEQFSEHVKAHVGIKDYVNKQISALRQELTRKKKDD